MPCRLINESLVVGITFLEEELATDHLFTCEDVDIIGDSPDGLGEVSNGPDKFADALKKRGVRLIKYLPLVDHNSSDGIGAGLVSSEGMRPREGTERHDAGSRAGQRPRVLP